MSQKVSRLKVGKRGRSDALCRSTRNPGDSPPCDHVGRHHEGEGDGKRNKLVPKWQILTAEHLQCKYCLLYPRDEADDLFMRCQNEFIYNSGRLAQVRLFGRWRDIPRKQVKHIFTFAGTKCTHLCSCIDTR